MSNTQDNFHRLKGLGAGRKVGAVTSFTTMFSWEIFSILFFSFPFKPRIKIKYRLKDETGLTQNVIPISQLPSLMPFSKTHSFSDVPASSSAHLLVYCSQKPRCYASFSQRLLFSFVASITNCARKKKKSLN